ncbi:MAG: hypothetical protein ED559_01075 [Phycisphaera sp.]|nr:MAG: hypothetical protein ED559_01075 [Phycisphaera sp.]
MQRACCLVGLALSCLTVGGCVQLERLNPDFPATHEEILSDRQRMRDNPVGLERPVLVLSGYRSPSLVASRLKRTIRRHTGADSGEIATLAYVWSGSVEEPARRAVARVEDRFPSDDSKWTSEVDVVAVSMGGLVARLAASDPELRGEPGGKRLRIGTLYTLATPHRGAKLAEDIHLDSATRAMIPGSDFLRVMDESFASRGYEVVPYAVLNDSWVGATKAAPVGQDPIWTAGRVFLSHHMVSLDSRIQTDLLRRLRGEKPIGQPGTPPSD